MFRRRSLRRLPFRSGERGIAPYRPKTVSDLIAVTTPPAAVGQEPVADLRQALCNNDRFLLARDLFGGDMDACGRTIDRLNEFDDLDECMIYIAENFDWNPNSDGAKLLVDLIERKLA